MVLEQLILDGCDATTASSNTSTPSVGLLEGQVSQWKSRTAGQQGPRGAQLSTLVSLDFLNFLLFCLSAVSPLRLHCGGGVNELGAALCLFGPALFTESGWLLRGPLA